MGPQGIRRPAHIRVGEVVRTGSFGLRQACGEAVFFIDLRGFTKFATECDPEEVIHVLDSFYRVLGKSFEKFDATVGAFQADGVMAYFGDPIPIENPAGRALDMASDLRGPLAQLLETWQSRGFDLNYGIGIALGYATLGMVGFEGRQDYSAIGTVVNLASRLCDEAVEGEVLMDRRARLAITSEHEVEPIDPKTIKGFRDPVPVFRLSSATADA
ncbi:MAG: adenylate/guanylate cyclase domain-containing protein [Actinomycetota bacterium]